MSNMPPLRTIHGRGAYMSRPRHTWRGYRPPRSARKRWEIEQMVRRARKSMPHLKLPEPEPCQEPACQMLASQGITLTPWPHELMHQITKEENVA